MTKNRMQEAKQSHVEITLTDVVDSVVVILQQSQSTPSPFGGGSSRGRGSSSSSSSSRDCSGSSSGYLTILDKS